MKTGRWFFALSVLLLAALLCALGPAACAEGPDGETAVRMDLSRLCAHADEIKTMREDALIGYLNCLFDAEETDDPAEQARLYDEADLLWTLYADLLSVQSKAEKAAFDPWETDAGVPETAEAPRPEPEDEYLLPDEAFLPGCDEYVWGVFDGPFPNGMGPWQEHDWMSGWEEWDHAFSGFDGFDDHCPGDFCEMPDENDCLPAEGPALEEKEDASDDAAAPDEAQDEIDVYMDWPGLDDAFIEALFGALFGDEPAAAAEPEAEAEQPVVGLPNPWTETDSLETAAAVSGLRLDPPAAEALPEGMELQRYRAMKGTVEADYSDGYDELTLRVSCDLDGFALSGDYNNYSCRWQETVEDLPVDCLGNGETVNVAAYRIGELAFSLNMAPGKEGVGLTLDELGALVADLKAAPADKDPAADVGADEESGDGVLEMPFDVSGAEDMSSEADDSAAAEETGDGARRTGGRPCRLVIGGGEVYVCFD